MKPPRVLKYILDMLTVIEELEKILEHVNGDYKIFKNDFISKRAAERDLEIIGEALNKLLKEDSSIKIKNADKIIGLRNIIAHAYDSVDDEIIWGILVKHIPLLKKELNEFM